MITQKKRTAYSNLAIDYSAGLINNNNNNEIKDVNEYSLFEY